MVCLTSGVNKFLLYGPLHQLCALIGYHFLSNSTHMIFSYSSACYIAQKRVRTSSSYLKIGCVGKALAVTVIWQTHAMMSAPAFLQQQYSKESRLILAIQSTFTCSRHSVVYQTTVEIVISEQWSWKVAWFLKEHYCPTRNHTTLHDHVLLVTFSTV